MLTEDPSSSHGQRYSLPGVSKAKIRHSAQPGKHLALPTVFRNCEDCGSFYVNVSILLAENHLKGLFPSLFARINILSSMLTLGKYRRYQTVPVLLSCGDSAREACLHAL